MRTEAAGVVERPRGEAADARCERADGCWARTREALAELLTQALGAPQRPPRLLGVQDELGIAEAASDAGPADPVHLYGHHAIVGPGPSPAGSPCPRCLARRWQAVRSGPLREALERGGDTVAVGDPPWAVPFLADALAALLAARRERPQAAPVHLLDLETLRVSGFPLLPDAECPHCDPRTEDRAEQARITLTSRPKSAPDDFRLRGIEEYRLSLPALVNPVAGMLGPSVIPDLVSATTSSTVGCFTMRSGSYLRESFWGGHTAAYRTSTQVGLLEGLERFAGMRPRGRRGTVLAALDELGEQALDPRECGLYSPEFHQLKPDVLPFSPSRAIPWVWGWSLREDRAVLVPEVLTYYHAPGGLRNRFVQESSNGCASGGCLEEAVYFGLMEVVERDAFLLSWYGGIALPELDPQRSTRAETRAMVDRLAMYGYRARFFDTRMGFPIPVVTAVAERIDGGLGRLAFGAGASLDPEAALWAGLCEIATDAVNLRRRTVREEHRLRAMAADFDQVRVLHDHPLLYGLPEMARHADFLLRSDGASPRASSPPTTSPRASSPPTTSPPASSPRASSPLADPASLARGPGAIRPGDDLREDLEQCVAAVTGAGFDVIVVDQTMPEQRALGLCTASVLVPGLLPIDFGWRRQRALTMPRLRTAPLRAGLRDRELSDADLNWAPHPFP